MNLLGIADLDSAALDGLLRTAAAYRPLLEEPSAKVDHLRGRTVVNLFLESSTRTRVSFELAGKLLSADVINFGSGGSSLAKGESLRDTVETLSDMGFDAIVIRHASAGVPHQLTGWTDAAVVNGGDGMHEHPTQALLDCLTLQQTFGPDISGLSIAFVGDFAHSRVARSATLAFSALGATVTLVAPPTLLPHDLSPWPARVVHDLDALIDEDPPDVVYTIRPQAERMSEALYPSVAEYVIRYGITDERFARLPARTRLLEAGPLVRGVQMSNAVADSPRNLMHNQVRNGVAVRMAVLATVLDAVPAEWVEGEQ